jgi:hypothetical protein
MKIRILENGEITEIFTSSGYSSESQSEVMLQTFVHEDNYPKCTSFEVSTYLTDGIEFPDYEKKNMRKMLFNLIQEHLKGKEEDLKTTKENYKNIFKDLLRKQKFEKLIDE